MLSPVNSSHFDTVYLDFEKAFDGVHHPTLISNLHALMTPSTVAWFESYLCDRMIQVRLNEATSSRRLISSGVPQGSHLAPPLFLLYINSLPAEIRHSIPYLFADDVTLFHKHKSQLSTGDNFQQLQKDVDACQQWASRVHGRFSAGKTSTMSNYSTPKASLLMDASPVSAVSRKLHLGVEITTDLDFKPHFTGMLSKFRQRVNLLCHMSRYLNPATISLLYKSYVRPTIEYAVMVWSFRVPTTQLAQLDILQASLPLSTKISQDKL